MDLLAQYRQSPTAVVAKTAPARLVDVSATRAAPLAVDLVDPPAEWLLDASAGWAVGMPVAQFAAAPGAELADRPDGPQPQTPAAPCLLCGSEFAWQALGDPLGANLHCCACVEIPSRRLLLRLWQVVAGPAEAGWPDGRPRWAPWAPQRWNPFGAIEAAEQKAEAARAASDGF